MLSAIKRILRGATRGNGIFGELAAQGTLDRLEEIYGSVAMRLATLESKLLSEDALRTERDQLMRTIQELSRPGTLTKAEITRGVLPFPKQLLPGRVLPSICIVDIGAQNLQEQAHVYQPLVDIGVAKVVGFEPLEEAAEARSKDANCTMLNHFVGNGAPATFRINAFDATSSLFASNMELLERFEDLYEICRTVEEKSVETTRLDDIAEIKDCDFLKIDVQGGELDVLKGAPHLLSRCLVVHCEAEFSPIYRDQPLFGDVDQFMRSMDFELIDLRNVGYSTMRALKRPLAASRLLWADAIYMRAPSSLLGLGVEKIARAVLIAHSNYGMYDVCAEFLSLLDKDVSTQYSDYLDDPKVRHKWSDGARRA